MIYECDYNETLLLLLWWEHYWVSCCWILISHMTKTGTTLVLKLDSLYNILSKRNEMETKILMQLSFSLTSLWFLSVFLQYGPNRQNFFWAFRWWTIYNCEPSFWATYQPNVFLLMRMKMNQINKTYTLYFPC